LEGPQLSRFVLITLLVGFPALAVGFGDFAGLPTQVVFAARLLAGLCLLLLSAYGISSISFSPPANKRGNNDRPISRLRR
jgi:hypothetical protein